MAIKSWALKKYHRTRITCLTPTIFLLNSFWSKIVPQKDMSLLSLVLESNLWDNLWPKRIQKQNGGREAYAACSTVSTLRVYWAFRALRRDLYQFLRELQTQKGWLTADQQASMSNPHPIALAIIHFPSSHTPTPAPAALTHCRLTTGVMVWSRTTISGVHETILKWLWNWNI